MTLPTTGDCKLWCTFDAMLAMGVTRGMLDGAIQHDNLRWFTPHELSTVADSLQRLGETVPMTGCKACDLTIGSFTFKADHVYYFLPDVTRMLRNHTAAASQHTNTPRRR
jgi:hypothetical protein